VASSFFGIPKGGKKEATTKALSSRKKRKKEKKGGGGKNRSSRERPRAEVKVRRWGRPGHYLCAALFRRPAQKREGETKTCSRLTRRGKTKKELNADRSLPSRRSAAEGKEKLKGVLHRLAQKRNKRARKQEIISASPDDRERCKSALGAHRIGKKSRRSNISASSPIRARWRANRQVR